MQTNIDDDRRKLVGNDAKIIVFNTQKLITRQI